MKIGAHHIGGRRGCFIIAEAGVNHNGSLAMAQKLVEAASAAGADAIKFQTFRAEKVVSRAAEKAPYQKKTTGHEQSQLEMVHALELSFADFRQLQSYCQQLDIIFLSTPFDYASVDFLDQLNVPAFKIASGEITNLPFLEHVAAKKRPIILSTGMSDMQEVRVAVQTVRHTADLELVLLHCVSNYPAREESVNLRAMETLRREFDCQVGYSDHTLGVEAAIAAAALGACIIEKHLTLDRSLPGPDHPASTPPAEFSDLIKAIRKVEVLLGDGIKRRMPEEEEVASAARRSIVASRDIAAGSLIALEDIEILRPGTGIAPALRDQVVGRRAASFIATGTPLTFEMLR